MAKQFLDVIELSSRENDEAFKKRVIDLLWTIYYWPLGRRLLEEITWRATSRLLTTKPRLFTTKLWIRKHEGAHDYKEFLGGGSLPGEHGQLLLDLNYCLKEPHEIDPTQDHVVQCGKTYAYLFHELVHYYHDLIGQFKRRGLLDEECRTVGLYEYRNEEFSENAFRKQPTMLLDRRPCYLWKRKLNPVIYDEEKQKRAALGLLEQSSLTRQSPECKFDAPAKP